MISIEEALSRVQQQEVNVVSCELPLQQALGHCLAEPLHAPFDLPSFDNSAVDGYALCGDFPEYRVSGEIPAGAAGGHVLSPGDSCRIFTGGPVPQGATAVVMQEHVRLEAGRLIVEKMPGTGSNIRRKGAELKAGQLVLERGHLLGPASLGVAASLGKSSLRICKKPSISLITTGNELLLPGEPIVEGKIYDANSQALRAALAAKGFDCEESLLLRDNLHDIRQGIAGQLSKADVLLLSGGISVGDYDFVKQALLENGVEEVFYRVFQKPGKPLFFGKKGKKFVFALPGNPASSLTCLWMYVLPLLQRLSGSSQTGLLSLEVPLAHPFRFVTDRPTFLKARIDQHQLTIPDGQGSSMIHSLTTANALAFCPRSREYEAGELVQCWLL